MMREGGRLEVGHNQNRVAFVWLSDPIEFVEHDSVSYPQRASGKVRSGLCGGAYICLELSGADLPNICDESGSPTGRYRKSHPSTLRYTGGPRASDTPAVGGASEQIDDDVSARISGKDHVKRRRALQHGMRPTHEIARAFWCAVDLQRHTEDLC